MNENKLRTSSEILIKDNPLEIPATDRRMVIMANNITKGKVLDVGCSHAVLYRYYLKDKKIDYYGIDICLERVEFMNKNFKDLNIILGDSEKLPYENDYFDYVVIGEVIEHIGNVENFLRECYRVLKSKGKLIGSTPNPLELKRVINGIFRIPYGHSQHVNIFGENELKVFLEFIGFKEITTKTDKVIQINYKKHFINMGWLGYLLPKFSKSIVFMGVKNGKKY